jgi:hypothetical protein
MFKVCLYMIVHNDSQISLVCSVALYFSKMALTKGLHYSKICFHITFGTLC